MNYFIIRMLSIVLISNTLLCSTQTDNFHPFNKKKSNSSISKFPGTARTLNEKTIHEYTKLQKMIFAVSSAGIIFRGLLYLTPHQTPSPTTHHYLRYRVDSSLNNSYIHQNKEIIKNIDDLIHPHEKEQKNQSWINIEKSTK